jgi:spore maturation protein CgeB
VSRSDVDRVLLTVDPLGGVFGYSIALGKQLAARGVEVIDDPPWARVVVYSGQGSDGLEAALERATAADLVVKASGVGVFDAELERAVADLRAPSRMVAFWDVDAPATLDRVEQAPEDPFRALIPRYDVVFTYGGGPNVVHRYIALGAQRCRIRPRR